jgi:Gluconate 2-dehydrogenase subunit 3
MDRRTSIQWVLAASAAWPLGGRSAASTQPAPNQPAAAGPATAVRASTVRGYGTDPNLLEVYRPGQLWPLTFTSAQRRLAGVLSDMIIPADDRSPAASAVGVVDFIDEWVSAPYPDCQRDRPIVLEGFGWLDAEAARRFRKRFAALDSRERHGICDDVCDEARAAAERRKAAHFFARYRDLTAGGFYSTPAGRKDLGYIGNVPLARFDGPPPELLKKLNLP